MKLKILIAAVCVILAAILVIVFVLPGSPDDPQKPTENTKQTEPDNNNTEPSDEILMSLGQELYIMRIGNYAGRYVEDGSDTEVESVAAVIVENRSQKTVQLADFTLNDGTNTYEFSLKTLPPGQRATVQEANKQSYTDAEAQFTAQMDRSVFFPAEPSLHEDVFAITGGDNAIELRNLTDETIPGPIYIYYKTRTSDGYLGGITYRVPVEDLDAGETVTVYSNHFWLGSSQVMFIDYAQ